MLLKRKAELKSMTKPTKLKRLLQILPLLSLLALPGCGSALGNLLVSSVKLTPAKPSIAVNGTQQFVLVETFIDGTTNHESPANTSWTSTNPAVATINNVGIATGLSGGTATIKGSHKDNDASTLLTVVAPGKRAYRCARRLANSTRYESEHRPANHIRSEHFSRFSNSLA